MQSASLANEKKIEKVVFALERMDCENCERTVTNFIAYEKGVVDFKTNLSNKTIEIKYNAQKTTKQKLINAFLKIGYKAVEISTTEKAAH